MTKASAGGFMGTYPAGGTRPMMGYFPAGGTPVNSSASALGDPFYSSDQLLTPFNGNFTDYSPLNEILTNSSVSIGPVATGAPGFNSQYALFNGSASLGFSSPGNLGNFGTGDFTAEMMILFTSVANATFITGSVSGSLYFQLFSGSLAVGANVVGNLITTGWSPSANTWYYIGVNRSGSTMSLQIDNNGATTATSSQSFAAFNSSATIGAGNGGSLSGGIFNLRITSGVARPLVRPTALYPTHR